MKTPNILLILADDVGTGDVPGYWGNHIVEMPNLMKLQSEGVTFMDAHSTPLCAPSRYMLLSGNYVHRGTNYIGSWSLRKQNNFRCKQKSLAHMLKRRAGYHTAAFGKWHLGAGLPPLLSTSGFDASISISLDRTKVNRTHLITGNSVDWSQPISDGPQDLGFDTSYVTMGGIQDPPYSFFLDGVLDHDLSDVVYWDVGDYPSVSGQWSKIKSSGEGSREWDSASYNMILVNKTLSFFEEHEHTRPNDPFFAYVALGQVHLPHSPPQYYLDGSPVAGEYENEHLDLLLEMDKVIGSLVSALEEKDLVNDTIIIFASDNGGLKTQHAGRVLRGFKSQIYEGGHRVPLVMRYDRMFPKNETRSSHFVGLNDLYATIAEIVGVKVPRRSAQDSISFASYIQSEENVQGLRKYLGTWAYKKNIIKGEAIRHGHLKLVRNYRKKIRMSSMIPAMI
jgi:Arylsulfatase A and related enzymes